MLLTVSLLSQVGMLNVFSNVTSDLNWVELLDNTNQLGQNLGIFFSQLQAPPITKFFMYNGSVTQWLEGIDDVFTKNFNQQAILQR